jgi:hypothetical protein
MHGAGRTLTLILTLLLQVYAWGVMERSYTGWPTVCWRVALFYPGIVIAIFSVMNLAIYQTGGAGGVEELDGA